MAVMMRRVREEEEEEEFNSRKFLLSSVERSEATHLAIKSSHPPLPLLMGMEMVGTVRAVVKMMTVAMVTVVQ
jgi:hypothetical protein